MQELDQLRSQVRRVQRRLGWQRFAGRLGWCWFAMLLVVLGLIVVDKYHPLGVSPWKWAAGGLGLGLAAAAAWTVATRKGALAAAIELDHRYGLKERVSSTLAMPPDQRATEAGRALLADAAGRVARIEVAEKFALRPPRPIFLPLLPGALALAVAWLVSPAVVDNPRAGNADAAMRKQVQQSAEALRRRLADRREEAEKLGLKDAEELLKRLEQGSQDLLSNPPERKQALVELSDLSRQLQQRRQQLQGTDKLQQQLEPLKNIERGPAEKFARSLAKGDFKQAAEALQQIKDQLANGQLDDQQKAELAKQLEQMQEKLNKLAEAHKTAREDLERRIDQLRQAGQTAEASKLQQQLDKLLEQASQMQQLGQWADKLGQCAQCLRDGQLPNAEQALGDLQAGLGEMQKQWDELQMLDATLDQLDHARDQMNCPHCGGEGCAWCQGDIAGDGLGQGFGVGQRPEAKTDTSTYDSHVKQKVGPGAAAVVGTANGPNIKGDVQQELQRQFDSAREGSTDPLSGRRIPHKQRQHAQEYFDRFREGK